MFTLLLLSLLHSTTSTVYTVTPDDLNTTCHHCHNLQHYLLNTTKYFTSNTQLLFLPGLHHLHTDLIIQNVYNISLVGKTTNATQNVVIQCQKEIISVGVYMINIMNLAISDLIIQDCHIDRNYQYSRLAYFYNTISLIFKDCNSVSVDGLQVRRYNGGILVINILGDSYFNDIGTIETRLLYLPEEHLVRQYSAIMISNSSPLSFIQLHVSSDSYMVVLRLSNITIIDGYYEFLGTDLHDSEVIITNSTFSSLKCYYTGHYFYSSRNGTLPFKHCQFKSSGNTIQYPLIKMLNKITMKIMHCIFITNNSPVLLANGGNDDNSMFTKVTIQDTIIKFSSNTFYNKLELDYIIKVSHTRLLLTGRVVFYNNTVLNSIIVLTNKSELFVDDNLQFINNTAISMIHFQHNNHEYIIINEGSVLKISQNYLCMLFSTASLVRVNPYPYCFFQYASYKNMGVFLLSFIIIITIKVCAKYTSNRTCLLVIANGYPSHHLTLHFPLM